MSEIVVTIHSPKSRQIIVVGDGSRRSYSEIIGEERSRWSRSKSKSKKVVILAAASANVVVAVVPVVILLVVRKSTYFLSTTAIRALHGRQGGGTVESPCGGIDCTLLAIKQYASSVLSRYRRRDQILIECPDNLNDTASWSRAWAGSVVWEEPHVRTYRERQYR